MRFPIDNALSPIIAERLRQDGHDAAHVRDIGLAAAADLEIFTRAQQQDRIVVSADADFGALIALRRERRPSIILFRGPTGRRPDRQAALLLANLPQLEQPLRDGCVAVFEEARVRLRMPPVGGEP